MLLAESQYPLLRDTNLPPDTERLVVIEEDSYPEPFPGNFQVLSNKLPRPVNSLLLEIVANAEVTQHLEKGEVRAVAHQLDISGTEALLAGCQAATGRYLFPGEVRLDLHHTGAGKKQGRVAMRYQRGTGD